MITVTPFARLGRFRNEWLNARHHFSFGEYYDPARMRHGALRVWNDDEIQPGAGFDPHPHRDMEIVTYIRRGAITHHDRLGNTGRTEAGDVQVMSAGRGIVHAEYNREPGPTLLFQIWIEPAARGVEPSWATRQFPKEGRDGFVPLASGRAGHEIALPIHQDAAVLGATLKSGATARYGLGADRKAYLVASEGRIRVNGIAADARDGVAVADEDGITVEALADAEVVLVDVPG